MAACMSGSLAACASTQVAETDVATVAAHSAAIAPKRSTAPEAQIVARSAPVKTARIQRGGGYQKLGKPYKIAGKLYVPQRDPNYDEIGVASWYGQQFHGRLTANGERFDMNSLSAAHPTMPLPAYARVTNMDNGRSVVVRVNDRGPFAHDRVIDLSRKTAAVLDFKHKGTARVRVQFVGDAPLDGKDEKFLVASYRGPGPAPALRSEENQKIATAYSPQPAPRPQTAFPDGLTSDEVDRNLVESGTPFDPYKLYPAARAEAQQQAAASSKSSYTANRRVSLAFTAIEDILR